MILMTVTYDGEIRRWSTRDEPLEHQWHGVIIDIEPVRLEIPTRHGGYLQVAAGRVTFTPSAFGGLQTWSLTAWPPPKDIAIEVSCTVGLEADATELFSGVLYRAEVREDSVVYDVYIGSYTQTIASGTSLASWPTVNSLIGFFDKVCDVLGLTLNSSRATASPPALSHVLGNKRLVIDVASEVAAACCHCFWVDGGTLHLVDMSSTDGNLSLSDPNDYLRSPVYSDDIPVNSVIAGAYEYVGSEAPWGVEYSLSASYTGDSSQLEQVYNLVSGEWCEVSVPARYGCGSFTPGKVITLRDTRLAVESEAEVIMRGVEYDFMRSTIKFSGHCEVVAL